MNILVACEYSAVVRTEFEKKGHNAWSCDLLPTEVPGNHYQGNIFDILYDNKWDLIIAHPPCTDLAVSGARWFEEKRKDGRQQKSIEFFMKFTKLKCKWGIENPIGIMSNLYRKPDQIIHPWMFGDSFSKATCLWLHDLPKLEPTNIVDKGEFVTFKSGKKMSKWMADSYGDSHLRSKTFPGFARAMAEQWG